MFENFRLALTNLYHLLGDHLIDELSPDQVDYLRSSAEQELNRNQLLYDRLGMPLYSIGAIIAVLVAPARIALVLAGALLFGLSEILVWRLYFRPSDVHALRKATLIRTMFGYLVAVSLYGYIVDLLLRGAVIIPSDMLGVGIVAGVMLIFLSVAMVFVGSLIVLFGIAIAAMTGLVFYIHHFDQPLIIATSLLVVALAISLFSIIQKRRSQRRALLEWDNQQLELQNKGLRLQGIERELLVARKLQDVTMRSYSSTVVGSRTIDFYQLPHGLLGGDWLAVHRTSSGQLVIAVGDVTGKGVAAAMVVHAVQALWVEHIGRSGFDPGQWLSAVNTTLFQMSARETHSMTLGLLVLSASEARYYAAGHLPLYLVGELHDVNTVRSIMRSGPILGMQRDAVFAAATLDLSGKGPALIALGTDGAMSWERRRSKHRLLSLLADACERGHDALVNQEVDDDQILVLIRPSDQAA